jgi:plastocyanin
VAALTCFASAAVAQDTPAPRILLDQSARAIEYQLGRLTDEQLARVERVAGDARYVPVYYALLTRAGMAEGIREEAITALMALEQTPRAGVLLEALQRSTAAAAAAPLQRLLLAQPAADLAAERGRFAAATARADASPFLLLGAYAAAMLAARAADAPWDAAAAREGHRTELLRGIAFLPASPDADALRRDLAPRVAAVVAAPAGDDEYVAAVAAVAATRRDAEAFRLLAEVVSTGGIAAAVAAAIDGLGLIPDREWPAAAVEPLVASLIARTTAMSPDERATREAIDAIGLAERLAGALPSARARALRTDLRALGVRVVRLEARPEQVAFDVRWFVVEAGKPVQIVFFNPDAMPHNVVIGAPGSLELLGTQGGAMPMPTDPAVKPFVPDLPQVIAATPLVTQGNTSRLGFIAPAAPGEYVFVCTFPGHWVRMYGVMLVVPDLDAWETTPTVPIDPMTKQPFAGQRTD